MLSTGSPRPAHKPHGEHLAILAIRIRADGWGTPSGHAASLLLVALVTLAGLLVPAPGGITNVGLLYLIPVMVAATRYGLRTGVVTGLASSLAYNFFFIPPTHTFTIQDPQNIISVLVLLGVAVVASQLAARVRAQALLAGRSAAHNSALATFAQGLTGLSVREAVAHRLCAETGRLLDVQTVLLVPSAGGLEIAAAAPRAPHLEMLDLTAARWAGDHNRPAGRGTDTLSASEWLFHPVSAGARLHGVFGMARADARAPLDADRAPLLQSLLDQAGLAFERIALEQEMAAIAHITERDRLRAALLSSVSHDLRTPLTAVLGALAALRAATPEDEAHLATARVEAERLARFVGNLLDMVRIEAGALHQTIEPVDLGEAVASAAHDLRGVLDDHPLRIAIAPDLPFVLVDPQLFHHCLINLIDNAAKYGPAGSPVDIVARREGAARLVLEVIDEGPGLPPGEAARVFDTFARIEGSDRKGGTGLGLAIVQGFAQAMGLAVTAGNRADRQGACFAIRFDAGHVKESAGEG